MDFALDVFLVTHGFCIILPDVTVDQIILEEHGSHDDGSVHEFEITMTIDGFVQKCSLCGYVKGK